MIKYEQKNYICSKHNDTFVKYCQDCHSNICFSCDDEHSQHNTKSLVEFKPDISLSKTKVEEIKLETEILSNQINNINKMVNELLDELNIYYEIDKNILKNYEAKNRNYQILQNINQISVNNEILQKLKNINEPEDIKNKIIGIIDLYDSMNNKIEANKIENEKIDNDMQELNNSRNKLSQMKI